MIFSKARRLRLSSASTVERRAREDSVSRSRSTSAATAAPASSMAVIALSSRMRSRSSTQRILLEGPELRVVHLRAYASVRGFGSAVAPRDSRRLQIFWPFFDLCVQVSTHSYLSGGRKSARGILQRVCVRRDRKSKRELDVLEEEYIVRHTTPAQRREILADPRLAQQYREDLKRYYESDELKPEAPPDH